MIGVLRQQFIIRNVVSIIAIMDKIDNAVIMRLIQQTFEVFKRGVCIEIS